MKRYFFFLIFTLHSVFLQAQELFLHDYKFKFIENKGQWPDFVFFRAETNQSKIYVEQGRVLYHFLDLSDLHKAHAKDFKGEPQLKQEIITAQFIGANKVAEIEKIKPSAEYYNYFIGNDKNKWASNVRGYADVTLKALYPGIDIHYNNQGDFLKYDFIVAPNADPNQIKIEYNNAKSVSKTKKGTLRIVGEIGLIEEAKPYVYQIINGKIIEIKCAYKLEKNAVSFELGKYDKAFELIIDPEIIFASYSGSLSDNFGMTATYDYEGNLFSGGIVFGNSYPTTAGAYDENGTFTQVNASANQSLLYGVTDIFISKYSADGSNLLYSTFIGGGSDFGGVDVVHSLICNEQNELYFFGVTSSSDFPLVNPVQATFNGGLYREFTSNGTHFWGNNQSQANGGTDLIVVKMSADGSNLLASTYYGGSLNDGLNYNENAVPNGNQFGGLMYNYGDPFRGEIMLDEADNVYVVSSTYSSDFPLINATQNVYGGNQDGVLLKFNPTLTSVLWSTYWGGEARDACYAVKFDSDNNIFASGGTLSTNFNVTQDAFQTVHGGAAQPDGFVTKFSPTFDVLNSTFIGTSLYDQSFFLQVDRDDFVYVLGQSRGTIAASAGKYSNPNSGQYIMKFDNSLTTQIWQTIFGNGNTLVNISPTAFLVDACGNIYVSGWGGGIAGSLQQGTALTNMPTTSDAFQTDSGNGYNFYLIVLSAEAEELIYASYLGGGQSQEHVDGGTSRFDRMGVVYHSACGGCGANSDFPTFPSDVWSSTNNSTNCNNLVFKFDFKIVPQSEFTVTEAVGCAPFEVNFNNISSDTTNFLWDFGDGVVVDNVVNPTHTFMQPGIYEAMLVVINDQCLLSDTSLVVITVYENVSLALPEDVVECEADEVFILANSSGTANSFLWSSNLNFTDTLNVFPLDSSLTVNTQIQGTFFIKISNEFCEKIDSITVTFVDGTLELLDSSIICLGSALPITVINTNPTIAFAYTWSPSTSIISGENEATVIVSPTSSQYIYLDAVAPNGCQIYDSIFIQVNTIDPNLINASALPDSVPPGGATVQLIGDAPSDFSTLWLPQSSVSNATALQTSAFVNQNTTFLFVATDSDGVCLDTVPVFVKTFEVFCEEPFLFVPNAFSPNGDGNNDLLYVRGPYIERMIFRVYNRWGEMVFESVNKDKGWDGVYKGKLCEPDVYDYYLDAECIGGFKKLITGNVTLVR